MKRLRAGWGARAWVLGGARLGAWGDALRGVCLSVATAAAVAGCAVQLVEVKERPLAGSPQLRAVQVERQWCEVEAQLALYLDESRQLWLSCPYRHEGRIVPLITYIGPGRPPQTERLSHGDVAEKIRASTRQPLQRCGTRRFCAELAGLGLFDFAVQLAEGKARVGYTDLSAGLPQVAAFYARLDGLAVAGPQPDAAPNAAPGAAPQPAQSPALDPALVRLVDPQQVVQRVAAVGSLAQHGRMRAQLEPLGLHEQPLIRAALESRHKVLTLAAHRQQGGFAGHHAAHQLAGESVDFEQMKQLATTPAERGIVFDLLAQEFARQRRAETAAQAQAFAATPAQQAQLAEFRAQLEQDRLAEQRRQDEQRQAEARREEQARQAQARRLEEARQAEARAQQARADEQRCLNHAPCRQALEAKRAACNAEIARCRRGCDSATGSGSFGFIGNLAAAGMARVCYAGCKCDSGMGDLLARFNQGSSSAAGVAAARPGANAQSGTSGSAGTRPGTSTSAREGVSTSASTSTSTSAAQAFECRIYCKSTTGPVIHRRIEAASRKQAAQRASDQANGFCAAAGHSHASTAAFPESQCVAR